jgi:hypothetical protein
MSICHEGMAYGEDYETCKEAGFFSNDTHDELIVASLAILVAAVIVVFVSGFLVGRFSVLRKQKRDKKHGD